MTQEFIEFQQGNITFKADSFKDLGALFAKIATVTGTMKRVQKNGTHSFQKWSYATWDDISEVLNQSLGENKLAVIQSMAEAPEFVQIGANNNGTPNIRASVVLDIVLACGETGATASVRWYGHADDTSGGEKAIDKALTYATKSFFKKMFVISTGGEDPEGNASEDGTNYSGQSQSKGKKQPPAQRPSVNEQPAPQQQPPPTQQAPAQQAPPAAQPPATKDTIPFKSKDLFVTEAKSMGYETADFKLILTYFGFADAKGVVGWSIEKHDSLLASLLAWKEFREVFLTAFSKGAGGEDPELLDKTVLEEMANVLGMHQPINAAAVRASIPMLKQHIAFNQEITKLDPTRMRASAILQQAGLLPWKSENTDKMLTIVKNALDVSFAADIVEDGAVLSDLTAGAPADYDPFVDATDTDEPSADGGDVLDSFFGEGAMQM